VSRNRVQVYLGVIVSLALAAFLIAGALRGDPPDGASAADGDIGVQGYDLNDICGKYAVFEMEMTSGFANEAAIEMPSTVVTTLVCDPFRLPGAAAVPQALWGVTTDGDAPWVDVYGDFVFDGNYDAEGMGTVAGVQDSRVVLDLFVDTDYNAMGTYTMGADGELPGGEPAVYAVNGVFGTDDVPTPSPTASPEPGQPAVWGNMNDCSGADNPPDPIDSLLTLRADAGLSTNTGDCPPFGTEVDVLNASLHLWGDVDCSGAVNPVDSLKLLRFDAGLSVAQEEGCPVIGSVVIILA